MKTIFATALLFATVFAQAPETEVEAKVETNAEKVEAKVGENGEPVYDPNSPKTAFSTVQTTTNVANVSGVYWTRAELLGPYNFFVEITTVTDATKKLAANRWLYTTIAFQKPAAAPKATATATVDTNTDTNTTKFGARNLQAPPTTATTTTTTAEVAAEPVPVASPWDTFYCGQKLVAIAGEDAKAVQADQMDADFLAFGRETPLTAVTVSSTNTTSNNNYTLFKGKTTATGVKPGSFKSVSPSTQTNNDGVYTLEDKITRSLRGNVDTFDFKGREKLVAQVGTVAFNSNGTTSNGQMTNYNWRSQNIDVTVLDSAATVAAGAVVVLAAALAF